MDSPQASPPVNRLSRLTALLAIGIALLAVATSRGETLRHPVPLETQLRQTEVAELVRQVRLRGNPERGAFVFYRSAAGCAKCHASGESASPLGPDLANPAPETDAAYLIESLLFPSQAIRKGFETVAVLTTDGRVIRGMVAEDGPETLALRDASDLSQKVTIPRDEIDTLTRSDQSMMPDGLVAVLPELRDFYDLASYVIAVAEGGPERAEALRPSAEKLAAGDDIADLDHAGILRRLRGRDLEAGEKIYQGYCYNCHGVDGNRPSLPTARAFGTQKLKFGADPYSMFLTLSKGNGLMAPMSHLTPKERYQVVHYIRERLMKDRNPDYVAVNDDYLEQLPKGSDLGDSVPTVDRDYGPALGSQLERRINSALTIRLGELTIAYDLHRLDVAGVWHGGFLDLDETQHIRGRGEGTARPQGSPIDALAVWRWGHDGELDYPTDQLPPRGPLPTKWLDYDGYYRHGERVVLSYAIDGRSILELPEAASSPGDAGARHALAQHLRIGPGKPLVLAVARGPAGLSESGDSWRETVLNGKRSRPASEPLVWTRRSGRGQPIGYAAVAVAGQTDGLRWTIDRQQRVVLSIPAADQPRVIEVLRETGTEAGGEEAFRLGWSQAHLPEPIDPETLTQGGPPLWPQKLTTVGYTGLEQGGYRLDTLTLPDQTPWKTWFRTSALDFFPDGRMVVTTYGGDVWIASGIDDDLLELTWKRFAGGLYEPFGVKVVDGKILVTCKDRLVRLHDLNGDGEADHYESFHADPDVSVNFHAFNFDLQVDDEGYFYYAKSGHGADFDLPGAVFRVSPEGRQHEVFATGFRTPNGMGALPGNRMTVSDNQGQWTPASKINLLRRGGFYGWVQTYSKPGMWAPGGGEIDIERVEPPKRFDPPLVWMPQEFDNSSGGQVFADDPRWGPLAGRLLHTSFGKGWMYYLMLQQVGETDQAAIIKLPFDFRTGIMRARVNPADGQVYATGLDGWNGGGRPGLRDRGIQRLVYTGKPVKLVTDCQVEPDGLRIDFNFPLDPNSARDLGSYLAEHWNYHWRAEYGSDFYSPKTDKPGKDPLGVVAAELSDDARSVKLVVPNLEPVNQIHLRLDLQATDGERFREEIYWTVNAVPGS